MELNYLEERLSLTGLHADPVQVRQFYAYYEILTEWNQFMNLTAITDFEDVVQKHFVDSLLIIKEKDLSGVDNLIDVGTGAGFPGIPLKIMFPDLKVTLLDSLKKRVDFLKEAAKTLELKNMEIIHGRAEDYAKPGKKRELYDLCVSRAVAHLSVLSEYCLPYVKIGGEFIAYKSGEIKDEMEAAKSAVFLLGGKVRKCVNYELPGTDIRRSLVCIEKVNGCPGKYPRKAGTAVKSPL